MRYLTYSNEQRDKYPICILVPTIQKNEILKAYIEPFGLDPEEIMVLEVHQNGKKTPIREIKLFLEEELLSIFEEWGTEYLIIGDAEYFKVITKASKADSNIGYVMPSVWGPQNCVYVPNFRTIFFDPEKIKAKVALGIEALKAHRTNSYKAPGTSIIKFAEYPHDPERIEWWLEKLLEANVDLTCDTENFSLKHYEAGIGTITFCWNKHEGIAFPVDLGPDPKRVRKALKSFFERFEKKLIFHYIAYDVYILVYQLFMRDILDIKGMLYGMKVLLRDWDDTKLITYLATNSCAGNKLGLKDQCQEFAGNYAVEEIHDITKIPLPKLLQYNLIDGLSTWYVHEKHWPTLVADGQLDIYREIFQPCTWDIIQMQLTGMPVNINQAKKVNDLLDQEEQKQLNTIMSHDIIAEFTHEYLNVKYAEKKNATWKKKRIEPSEANQEFNPNSDIQMRALLFDFLHLPIINYTDSKQPSTDGETIEALLNQVDDSKIKKLLEAIQLHTIVGTLTTTFMPAILGAVEGPDGWHYLFGSFNLGGTLSGRLSSSNPNLQNLPSTGKGHKIKLKYAKMIKSCFAAPPGWLFVGVDFSSLEDKISALTTKDPNKLKVYTDGYDGHSLRAYAYWPEKMPDIDSNSVESINSIAKKYKPLRDKSKNPTFTLTYQGTKHALMKKYGFSETEADEVVARYQQLYKVSIDWVNAKLDQAMIDGYITGAFGLRLRTPLLHQVIRGTSKTPREAEAEGRTAGNALGQSWCLLNSRAHMAFMKKVRESKYKYDIRHCSQIHDAGYYIIRDDIEVLEFTNTHLVAETYWQEHPDIAHDEVKLGGELFVCYPDWAHEISIPNNASKAEIFQAIDTALASKD